MCRFWIYNSKLRVWGNIGKLFTKGISLEILSKESRVGNAEKDNVTLSFLC